MFLVIEKKFDCDCFDEEGGVFLGKWYVDDCFGVLYEVGLE